MFNRLLLYEMEEYFLLENVFAFPPPSGSDTSWQGTRGQSFPEEAESDEETIFISEGQ